MHRISGSGTLLVLGLSLSGLVFYFWCSDVFYESELGYHTDEVIRGFRIGFILFIVSETMLFFSFFWAFFHSSMSPSIFIGGVWPPPGIVPPDPFSLPLVNTILLLTSGGLVTVGHHIFCSANLDEPSQDYYKKLERQFWDQIQDGYISIVSKRQYVLLYLIYSMFKSVIWPDAIGKPRVLTRFEGTSYIFFGILLGCLFVCNQFIEYNENQFSINDGIFGSVFYFLTGLHGLHVIGGLIGLTVFFVRMLSDELKVDPNCHPGLECSLWYWHFVDFIWLFLYVFLYCLAFINVS